MLNNERKKEMKTKARFLMNYLNEVEPLSYGNMQKLLKNLIKTNQGYKLKTHNFKNTKGHKGYWCTNLKRLRSKGLIKKNDKTKLYKTTSRGLKYWDKPFSKFIPPKGKTESEWKKFIQDREKKVNEHWERKKRERITEDRWIGLAKAELLNKKITTVRYMHQHEMLQFGFHKRPVVFQLEDGNWIVPMMDDEGNDGGALSTSKMVLPVLY
jgi:hypothetical protein